MPPSPGGPGLTPFNPIRPPGLTPLHPTFSVQRGGWLVAEVLTDLDCQISSEFRLGGPLFVGFGFSITAITRSRAITAILHDPLPINLRPSAYRERGPSKATSGQKFSPASQRSLENVKKITVRTSA